MYINKNNIPNSVFFQVPRKSGNPVFAINCVIFMHV